MLELIAANHDSGAARIIIHEEWPTGWIDNRPLIQFLKQPGDSRRFIWESEP